MRYILSVVGVGAIVTATAAVAMADMRTTSEAKPLSELAALIEKQGYVIVEAERERGGWEVEVFMGDKQFELKVNAATGAIVATRPDSGGVAPPMGSKPLSKIAAAVEAAGYVVTEAEFERDAWDIDAEREGMEFDIIVDAKTGKIVSEKRD